jgi:hypothetical protein
MFSRLLSLLQLTRMALVFTAISNGWAAMLLESKATGHVWTWSYGLAMTIASVGLYTFGMALNDVIDRRRDAQIAPTRPLPSGRISVRAAHGLCIVLGVISIAGCAWMNVIQPGQWMSVLIGAGTLGLICFYDFAGKYLVAAGLLTLGLIRFFHASIAAPTLAFPWQAMLLLLHVTLLSAACYHLEGKRPRLTLRHWLGISFGLAAILSTVPWHFTQQPVHASASDSFSDIAPMLKYVVPAMIAFIVLTIILVLRSTDSRATGRAMMLYGLLWLIIYDTCFVLAYVGWREALVIVLLLPTAWVAVQTMRAWGRMIDISTKPQYQRAR